MVPNMFSYHTPMDCLACAPYFGDHWARAPNCC